MQVERMLGKAHPRMLSPSLSPATSPTLSVHTSSPTPPTPGVAASAGAPYATPKQLSGIPCVAAASRYTAPVHIDVGGTIYTSSLETLTKFSDSRLAKMFNGQIAIVLDSLKQHYFIDRDGRMFRHVLNFVRNARLLLPDDFADIDLLLEEAKFYEITAMIKALEELRSERQSRHGRPIHGTEIKGSYNGHVTPGGVSSNAAPASGRHSPTPAGRRSASVVTSSNREQQRKQSLEAHTDANRLGWECLALYISPDLGERIMLSGERALVEEVFPEIAHPLMDARTNVAWNQNPRHVIRFPLNGYCKLNSMQAITRLLNGNFTIAASSGGGVEGQQFSEYLFVRKAEPL